MYFLVIILLLLTLCALLILPVAVKGIGPERLDLINEALGNTNPCKCVIFRLDDIQDGYLDAEQIKIMDLFLSKGEPLSLGLVMHNFGNDTSILNKISEGYKKGLFELGLHGWEHKNYSSLSEQEQKSSLYKANERMQTIFGKKSDIFIPPFNKFNNDTLDAIKELGIRIISSSIMDQYRFDLGSSIFISNAKKQNSSTPQVIYYLPYTTDFKDFIGRSQIKFPIEVVAKNIDANIEKYGYAIVLIHPQSFIKLDQSGHFISEDADKSQMNMKDTKDLEYLINLLTQKGIVISTFHKLSGIELNSTELPIVNSTELPIVKDPNLKVQLIYQGQFKVQPFQSSPVSTMSFLGNDILILDKNSGTIHRIKNGTIVGSPLLDVNVANKHERGLLGIASSKTVDGKVQYVFVYYTESKKMDGTDICHTTYYCVPGTEPIDNRLYRYELVNDKLVNPKLLLDLPATPGPSHVGGVIKIGPDNNLYVTIGDLDGSVNKSSSTMAQNFKNGTQADGRAGILRITQDGKPVLKEGILGNEYPLNLYYAYGIRNSFGIDFDPITGNLWDTENGPAYGDEINLVEPGFNSGWIVVQGFWKPIPISIPGSDLVAGSKLLSPTDLVNFGGKGKYSPPEFVWKNTVGPTALVFLNSSKLGNEYENDMFVGSVNSGILFHFDLSKNRSELSLNGVLKDRIADNKTELNESIFGKGFDGLTDLDVGPDGYLYILSFKGSNASIYRIVPKGAS
jgi:glucose/arabinose dehydrogenase/peptidoglycan/xylan/chitin deacetylase (PgdA/CDA1 family)